METSHPPVPAMGSPAESKSSGSMNSMLLGAGVALAAFGIALVVSGLAGVAVFALVASDGDTGWLEGLESLIIAAGVAVLVGAVAYLVSGVLIIGRVRPSGDRVLAIVTLIVLPIVLFGLLVLLAVIG